MCEAREEEDVASVPGCMGRHSRHSGMPRHLRLLLLERHRALGPLRARAVAIVSDAACFHSDTFIFIALTPAVATASRAGAAATAAAHTTSPPLA